MSQPIPIPAPIPAPVDLHDVQGDIILGLPKRVEDFIFFVITNVEKFRHVVGSEKFLKLITTTADIQDTRKKIRDHKDQHKGKACPLIPVAAVNIAFTQTGLTKLGITDDLGDAPFKQGQLARAGPDILEDRGQLVGGVFDPDWHKEFKGEIHGIILVAGDSKNSIDKTVKEVEGLLEHTIKVVNQVHGNVRPGPEKGHEHFGYRDGISSPAPKGIVSPLPGQQVVDPGVILLGHPGDGAAATRPSWAKNGSFLVYRHLEQFVPEFDQFKRDNALNPLELGIDQGAEFLGSRLFGRWKSGAPVELATLKDDPELAADPQRNNNFKFSTDENGGLAQVKCPFAAHIRKTNPRFDINNAGVAARSIIRSGIPFGPEVTPQEHRHKKTEHTRGLSFVCYQSNLTLGFEFQQHLWANNEGFVTAGAGHDPIIGQNGNASRTMGGFDPKALENNLPINFNFVQSKGGAYFFSPSITALKTKIGTK